MRQPDDERRNGAAGPALTEGERLVVRALRRAAPGSRGRHPARPDDLDGAVAALGGVFRPGDLGAPESLALTRGERRLLHAIAAAQHEDAEMLDDYLYKLALDSEARSRLAEAVTSLAACLAMQGHRLTRRAGCSCIPAAALTVARAHGWDVDVLSVDWPRDGAA
jgi:hypothetical protein